MIGTNGGTQIVDQLQALLDRLGSPDLTLAEAKGLREKVMGLVADRAPASPPNAGAAGSPTPGGRKVPPRAGVLLRSR